MVSEQQKYDSTTLRNVGFAFWAPLGSIGFQVIVFEKPYMDSNLFLAIIVFVIGCILIYLGRDAIKEKDKK